VKRFPLIAGMNRGQWEERGMVMSHPNGSPVVTAEQAERIALTRNPGATNPQPTFVHVEFPRSQVLPSADYWAVSMTPPPEGDVDPLSRRQVGAFTHLVALVDAKSGRVPLVQMWGPGSRRRGSHPTGAVVKTLHHATATVSYLSRIPASVPEGLALVHNSVKPSGGGFRYWLQRPSDSPSIVPCRCEWAPELALHYRVNRPDIERERES
jgi:hypothetical protein